MMGTSPREREERRGEKGEEKAVAWKRCVVILLERDLNENRRGGDGSECGTERDKRN
jgi:hypothetical protein